MSDSTISQDAIGIERIFDAPVEIVWQMWTQPEHFKNWYGPNGATVPVAEMDVRVGGRHLFCMEMQRPDGSMKIWTTGEYTEVVPNKRLVYTETMADEAGNVVTSENYPAITEVTVLLEDLGGRTKMIMRHTGVPGNEQGANEAWKQSFAKLADHIEAVIKKRQ
jgi:uncharacterized protein YndB with AHSA1/START domain